MIDPARDGLFDQVFEEPQEFPPAPKRVAARNASNLLANFGSICDWCRVGHSSFRIPQVTDVLRSSSISARQSVVTSVRPRDGATECLPPPDVLPLLYQGTLRPADSRL